MDQILQAYIVPEETVTAMIMLYCNTKFWVCLPDRDTDFFEIAAGVLQRDTLVSYLFLIRQKDALQTTIDRRKENGLTLKKSKQQTIPCSYYYERRLCR